MKFRKAIVFLLCAIMGLSVLACGTIESPNGGGGGGGGGVLCTVIFDNNAPAGKTVVNNVTAIQVEKGKSMGSKYPTPTCDGYQFGGWFSGSTQYSAETVINSDLTLKAKWVTNEEVAAAAQAYENAISSWAKPGHLYIHYKRASHKSGEAVTPPTAGVGSGAPLYSTASTSEVYGDWGLWCWPQGGEGRTFNPAWIDESGAVYDVDLTQTYNDAGWDGTTVPGKPLKNTMT